MRDAGLIRKVYFPREVLPIATVLFTFSQLLLALAVFVPALLWVSGGRLNWPVVLVVPVLLLHLLFTLGIGFILALSTVFFRDVAHLTEVAVVLLLLADADHLSRDHGPRSTPGLLRVEPAGGVRQDVPGRPVLGAAAGGPRRLDRARRGRAALLGGYALFRRFGPNLRRGSVGVDWAVELRGVSKVFVLRHNPARNLKIRADRHVHPVPRAAREVLGAPTASTSGARRASASA